VLRGMHYRAIMSVGRCLTILSVAAMGLATASCDDLETGTATFVVPTEVAVHPDDFRGDVGCGVFTGSMKSFVVTLHTYDDANDITPFTIGSTVPTPCSLIAGFRQMIVAGQLYTAEVDAYDVPVSQLTPFGGSSSGARQMRDAETGEPVAPRWTTSCGGSVSTAVVAESNRRVLVRPCDDLVDANPSPTQLAITPRNVLGDSPCDIAQSYDVSFISGELATTTGVSCSADEGAVFDATAGTTYDIYATATVAGTLAGTRCLAKGREGETVEPTCELLSFERNVGLALATLMADEQRVCPADAYYDVIGDDGTLNAVPIPCDQSAQLGPFAAGITLLSVTVYDATGMPLGAGATCAADVLPGTLTDATCVAATP